MVLGHAPARCEGKATRLPQFPGGWSRDPEMGGFSIEDGAPKIPSGNLT